MGVPPAPQLTAAPTGRQDVAFFDANRTGQLVNRLTADIQEFKSSFKLAISQVRRAAGSTSTLLASLCPPAPTPAPSPRQGLRSGTQTAGCFVSLYLLSPKLTGLLLVALPSLVGAGALIGAALRSLSRRAQEQVTPHPPALLPPKGPPHTPRGWSRGCPASSSLSVPLSAGGQGHCGGRRGAGKRSDCACLRHGGPAGSVRGQRGGVMLAGGPRGAGGSPCLCLQAVLC